MLKYEIIGSTTLSINLHNGYSIIAIAKWDNDENCYYSNFYIKENTIDHFDLIDDCQYMNVKFKSERKNINHDITIYISNLNANGVFNKFIKRYEYEMMCFDRGNEINNAK